MTDLRQVMEREYEAYKKIQADMSKVINTRTQLVSQATENQGVLEELGRLGEDANVFKLIGPALIKQDLVEAKSNVSKRLEYIKGEIDRAETQIKSFESKSKQHEQELIKIQSKIKSVQGAQ
uniref:Prefoldin subunit 6 n=1 Tax=Chlamydomonas leiostraca TaxID=1034604 RepID=A0A7S0S3N0_9CHLO|mmetsp:Transcript_7358/g.18261  ORF Transcript_7358/g.18261 Transcript_7358/m.18261 type:complete len:122 (+) Transcript_7358:95-460(+)|eukprot:CAMPEP_0202867746 /NCGR_PEP_ID=MMETSP1391-20130828/9601_1 /ASSEMBLY_ACC=CAM_ASM_000867 /TAXON_ID=1034604 /ORGANISM="Chlamydomonas leiostraca, Strain SAG 11-49" /LENGTH=121 /DNA_ID=CAMNT_0049547809 /DNA_START=75 /DNA_END=440 /DNA_ORIENTATION=+